MRKHVQQLSLDDRRLLCREMKSWIKEIENIDKFFNMYIGLKDCYTKLACMNFDREKINSKGGNQKK